jgi:hypothetical protein
MTRIQGFLAALGLLIGVIAGTYYAWVVNPVSYTRTSPFSLRSEDKDDYRSLVASAYAQTIDLPRAAARLSFLQDQDPIQELGALAQNRLGAGLPQADIQPIAVLARDLSMAIEDGSNPFLATATASSLTSQPDATSVPHPVPSRTPHLIPNYQLTSRRSICDQSAPPALIRVEVLGRNDAGVPGVELSVLWNNGQDHFFTGLKPQFGSGYADFTMVEGSSYTLTIVDSLTAAVTGLQIPLCIDENGEVHSGSWELRFELQ